MGNEKATKPFGLKDKVGYMCGNIANDFTFTFASIYLQVFYVKVLGISAVWTGLLFLIARIVDAFTDISMGRIVDKMAPGKDGKFKRWLRWGCAPVALASFLMYQSSMADASMTLRVVYMFVTYLLWGSICYTAINIPYGSMASVVSSESDHRASLSTFRSMGSLVANIIVGVVVPMFIYEQDAMGNQVVQTKVFTIMAGILSILALVFYLICFFTTTERVKTEKVVEKESVSLIQTMKSIVTSRAMIGIIIATIAIMAAQLLNQTINQFLFLDYFKNSSGVSIMSALGMLPSLIIAPIAVPVSKRFGKREVGIFGGICGALGSILLFFVRTTSIWVYIGVNIVVFLGFGVFNLVMWAFITDIIDDLEVRTGNRDDGTIYGAYSFSRKLGQAIAGGLGGWLLTMIGYNESIQVQAESVVQGIYNIATMVPGILYTIMALSLWLIYPLTKKKVEENIAILKERRAKQILE